METLLLAELVLPLLAGTVLLLIGFFVGRMLEMKHYASIMARETAPGQVMIFAERFPPPDGRAMDSRLVMGSVVISVDYFKRFIAGLRALIGGRLNSYESLIDRARREAALRMREHAARLGATQVFNVKFETAAISGRKAGAVIGSLEVLAYGTAIIPKGN